MAKFYIQSGNVSFVVGANDAQGAALWAMHQTIERMVDAYEAEYNEAQLAKEAFGFGEDEIIETGELCDDPMENILEPMLDGLSQFAETIHCSERGFGHDDAGELQTEEIFRQWRQLMQAADQLFDRLN